jgi:peptidoglycan/xylan/chitin deacetylase (PgdA/CDA1 family)
MMTIGLHCRVIGKPARIGALERFLDHLKAKGAWVTTREAIADHWMSLYPYDPETAW